MMRWVEINRKNEKRGEEKVRMKREKVGNGIEKEKKWENNRE